MIVRVLLCAGERTHFGERVWVVLPCCFPGLCVQSGGFEEVLGRLQMLHVCVLWKSGAGWPRGDARVCCGCTFARNASISTSENLSLVLLAVAFKRIWQLVQTDVSRSLLSRSYSGMSFWSFVRIALLSGRYTKSRARLAFLQALWLMCFWQKKHNVIRNLSCWGSSSAASGYRRFMIFGVRMTDFSALQLLATIMWERASGVISKWWREKNELFFWKIFQNLSIFFHNTQTAFSHQWCGT